MSIVADTLSRASTHLDHFLFVFFLVSSTRDDASAVSPKLCMAPTVEALGVLQLVDLFAFSRRKRYGHQKLEWKTGTLLSRNRGGGGGGGNAHTDTAQTC